MVLDFLVWDSANAKPSRFQETEEVLVKHVPN